MKQQGAPGTGRGGAHRVDANIMLKNKSTTMINAHVLGSITFFSNFSHLLRLTIDPSFAKPFRVLLNQEMLSWISMIKKNIPKRATWFYSFHPKDKVQSSYGSIYHRGYHLEATNKTQCCNHYKISWISYPLMSYFPDLCVGERPPLPGFLQS